MTLDHYTAFWGKSKGGGREKCGNWGKMMKNGGKWCLHNAGAYGKIEVWILIRQS